MMALIAPSLEDMGIVIFGLDWHEPLANSLGVSLEVVTGWDEDPTTIPDHIEGALRKIGLIRIQEIEAMLAHILETGVERRALDAEEGDEN
jgi:hypothetical protein